MLESVLQAIAESHELQSEWIRNSRRRSLCGEDSLWRMEAYAARWRCVAGHWPVFRMTSPSSSRRTNVRRVRAFWPTVRARIGSTNCEQTYRMATRRAERQKDSEHGFYEYAPGFCAGESHVVLGTAATFWARLPSATASPFLTQVVRLLLTMVPATARQVLDEDAVIVHGRPLTPSADCVRQQLLDDAR